MDDLLFNIEFQYDSPYLLMAIQTLQRSLDDDPEQQCEVIQMRYQASDPRRKVGLNSHGIDIVEQPHQALPRIILAISSFITRNLIRQFKFIITI